MAARAEFSDADLAQLRSRGITVAEATRQLEILRRQPPATKLDRPCTVGDGIVQLAAADRTRLAAAGEKAALEGRVTKFVPASGAATRMFKDLVSAAASEARPSTSPAARTFFERIDDFAFAEHLRQCSGVSGEIRSEEAERAVLRALLQEMRYADLPKALIPFHRLKRSRTAFEEHLLEATHYARAASGIAKTHFTIAPGSRAEFEEALQRLTGAVESETGAVVAVTFSEQHPSTDTLALAADGEPFRDAEGALLFRPAGHGALLQNLNAIGGDLIAIKNIDNILPDERSQEVAHWKRVLIGCLATLLAERRFDRPVRVCGVVRNEGEPGGAPFWVVDEQGQRSLQIVESSQVDLGDPEQRRIFDSSTHFNPVDLVCAVRAADGRPFDLESFVDPAAVFLSEKSYEGRDLIALERPGLWNGAMARWHTVFVEVPASTFAPVKTVLDLLRPQHQSL